jgi:hypothetical protein
MLIIKIRYERARLTSEPKHVAGNMVKIADGNTIMLIATRDAVFRLSPMVNDE